MSTNNRTISTAGLSPTTAEAVSTIAAQLQASPLFRNADSKLQDFAALVEYLRELNA